MKEEKTIQLDVGNGSQLSTPPRVLSANPANPPVEKDDQAYEGAEQEG
jgi:hypothetical protein